MQPGTTPQDLPAELPAELWSVDHLVTEDDTPMDNRPSARQQRLLVDALHNAWNPGRPYLACANVGLFFARNEPAMVPDFLLSLDVEDAATLHEGFLKENRSYFVWLIGKLPEIVIEIVSNREGGEDDRKLKTYARYRILYYVMYDPEQLLGKQPLRVMKLQGANYEAIAGDWLPEVGLGLKLWHGKFEKMHGPWLRWCDERGDVLPTAAEDKTAERQRADQEKKLREQAQQRAERLAEKLRQAGIDPDE